MFKSKLNTHSKLLGCTAATALTLWRCTLPAVPRPKSDDAGTPAQALEARNACGCVSPAECTCTRRGRRCTLSSGTRTTSLACMHLATTPMASRMGNVPAVMPKHVTTQKGTVCFWGFAFVPFVPSSCTCAVNLYHVALITFAHAAKRGTHTTLPVLAAPQHGHACTTRCAVTTSHAAASSVPHAGRHARWQNSPYRDGYHYSRHSVVVLPPQ